MRIVKPTSDITFHVPEGYESVEQFLEEVGRTPYKSEERITEDSAGDFIGKLVRSKHWAMIEHCVATVRFVADRGFSHEIVRHRLASFAQESTRYVNYTKDGHGGQITVIGLPDVPGMNQELRDFWQKCCIQMEENYFEAERLAVKAGIKKPAQIARMWLPIGVKTEIVMTANLREWNTVFGLRADSPAHPIMRGLARGILAKFYKQMPAIFGPLYRQLTPASELTPDERKAALKELGVQVSKLQRRAGKISALLEEAPGRMEDEN